MSRYDDVGGADGPAPPRGPRGRSRPHLRRRSRPHLRRRIAAWVSVSLTFVLVVAALGAYVEYRNVVASIHRVTITDLGKRPPKYTSALNLLVIGSDSRKGANRRFGASLADGLQRSDTVMLLHLSPGRHGATVVSFPRDSTVPILACAAHGTGNPGQQVSPGSVEQINSTFANGGPACLWKTVEQTTGIRIDHFVELNFTGFIHVVNDIGGVNVCLPFAVKDIAAAMTTDMDTSSLLQIAESVQGLSAKSVQFIQVPSATATVNANWVTWTPQASALFAAIAHDRKLPKPGKKVTGPKTTPVLDASPSQVDVQVLNGSGVAGIASSVAAGLTSRQFNVVGTGDASSFGYTNSVIKYASPADKAAVKTLKHQLSNVTVEQDSSLIPGTLELIIGSAYQGLRASPSPSASPARSKPAVGSLAKNFNGIRGNASCRSDRAAFAGPNSPPVP